MGLDRSAKAAIVVSSVFPVVASATVALRIYARKSASLSFFADDYLIFVALIVLIGTAVPCVITSSIISRNGVDNMSSDSALFKKLFFAMQLIYVFSVAIVKISILLFYKRIFPTKNFKLASNVVLALVYAWFIAFFCVTLFHLNPIAANWEGFPCPEALDFNAASVVLGATDTVLDLATLVLPWPIVYGLHVTARKKWILCGIFLLSGFTCVASGVRLYYLKTVSYDAGSSEIQHSDDLLNTVLWSSIETAGGITCACLPTLGPILKKHTTTTFITAFNARFKLPKLNTSRSTNDEYTLHTEQERELPRYNTRPKSVPKLSFDSKRVISSVGTSPALEADGWSLNGEGDGEMRGIMVQTHMSTMSEESVTGSMGVAQPDP